MVGIEAKDLIGAEHLRELLDAAPDAIIIVNEQGVIRFASQKAEELFGWPAADLIGQAVELLVPERFRGSHVHHRSRYVFSPAGRPMGSGLELFGRRRDGSEFPIEISLSPLKTSAGLLVSSAIRDISERKRVEAEARLAAENLRSAVESMTGAFALFDPEDKLVLCNSAGVMFFTRRDERSILGQTCARLIEAALAEDVFELGEESRKGFLGRYLAYRQNPDGTFDVRTRDGHNLRFIDRRTPEGGTVTTIWDMTADFARELELDRLREAALAASAAKSEFLSSMSHELRTPLNAVLGFAQLLHRDKKEPLGDRQKGMLDHVIRGGEHLLRLIDEVLDLARIETGRMTLSPEPVSVPEVLTEVMETLSPMATRAGIELSIANPPTDLPKVIADRTRFAQILMNYGSNAIKYGNRGGKAVFEVSVLSPNRLRITVADTGIGIPADKQDKIFQPFQRAGQETGSIEGTGIGLAITKRLAEAMTGAVGFQSKEGQGSRFWVELPIYRASAESGAAKQDLSTRAISALAHPDARRFTIVYIEDNPSNIAFMEGLVSQLEKVELRTAPSAEIGIELVRAHKPDVVIMDINLPGMSGLEATSRLREWPETREIPVIGLSAAAMARDKKRAAEVGFFRYLTKPVNVDELTGALEELMRRRDPAGQR
jgi:PAS domain S-box-containing protein